MHKLYPIIRRKRVPLAMRHAAPVTVPVIAERTAATQAEDAPGVGPVEVLPGSLAPSAPLASPTPVVAETPVPAPASVSVKAALTRAARRKASCAIPATSSANGN